MRHRYVTTTLRIRFPRRIRPCIIDTDKSPASASRLLPTDGQTVVLYGIPTPHALRLPTLTPDLPHRTAHRIQLTLDPSHSGSHRITSNHLQHQYAKAWMPSKRSLPPT